MGDVQVVISLQAVYEYHVQQIQLDMWEISSLSDAKCPKAVCFNQLVNNYCLTLGSQQLQQNQQTIDSVEKLVLYKNTTTKKL